MNSKRYKESKKLIIIPAYNEAENIEKTVEMIQREASGFDYIIINDCSTDETASICRQKGFPFLDLPVNLGIGGAVQAGYQYALECGYDMAAQVDADGHWFLTQSNGNDAVKTPEEMFSEKKIPNDLLIVDNAIREYYGMKEVNKKK